MEAVFVYAAPKKRQWMSKGQLEANKRRTARIMTVFTCNAGEGGDITWVTYPGKVGVFIS